MAQFAAAVPTEWAVNQAGKLSKYGQLVRYDHRRVGALRRRLSFPNPIHYYHLSRTIAREWDAIEAYLNIGDWSLLRPTTTRGSGRAFASWLKKGNARRITARVRQSARVIVQTDIARFYPSIYTHSIPWALHGKAAAKDDSSFALYGNELDYWVRNGQDRQTMGVPIGPDASWVIAEIIIAAVEHELQASTPAVGGQIIIDDIELGFRNQRDAEIGLSELEATLAQFELSLNPRKTRTVRLPQPLAQHWAERLSLFAFRDKPTQFRADLFKYFSLAFRLASRLPNEPVLNYALTRLHSIGVDPKHGRVYQPLLLQCAGVEPAALPLVGKELALLQSGGADLDFDGLGDVLHTIISEHAPLGRTSEVAWALWTGISFDLPFDEEATTAVCAMADDVVALLALDANNRGLMPYGFDPSLWASLQTGEQLWGSHWLLSYEANIKGWLPSGGNPDHVTSDQWYNLLKRKDVQFYGAGQRIVPSRPRLIARYTTGANYQL